MVHLEGVEDLEMMVHPESVAMMEALGTKMT